MSSFAISNETWKHDEFDIYYSNPKNYVKCFRIFIFDGYNILNAFIQGFLALKKLLFLKFLRLAVKKFISFDQTLFCMSFKVTHYAYKQKFANITI